MSPERLTEASGAELLLSDLTPPCQARYRHAGPCARPAAWILTYQCPTDTKPRRGAACREHASDAASGGMACNSHYSARVELLSMERL